VSVNETYTGGSRDSGHGKTAGETAPGGYVH